MKIQPSLLLLLLLAQLFSTMVEARVFTNKQGREIDAEIISVASPEVKIKRADGKVFTMLIDTFTDEDQAFIRTWKLAGSPPEGAPPAPPTNSDLKPGETLKLDFPDLAPDRKGEPATCSVKLPGAYDPAKRYPLVVWLAGGDGGNQPGGGFVPEGDFVTAGLPFPKDANNPAQSNMVGEFDLIWEYHRAMLDEIHRHVPNIERSSSVIGGFSNGAHAIDGMLRVRGGKEGGLADYFAAFVLADGGGSDSAKGSYPSLKGKFAYCCYGETSPAAGIVPNAAKDFKGRGAETVLSEMAGTGHAFAEFEQVKVKEWLVGTVLPAVRGGTAAGN